MKLHVKEHWCKLLNESNIGDIITYDGTTILVEEYTGKENKCQLCAFNKTNGCDLYCTSVTPCSPFNNQLGKSIVFIKQKIN